MFFDISAKSQVNTFSINENYAGLVLASDINRLSCSINILLMILEEQNQIQKNLYGKT